MTFVDTDSHYWLFEGGPNASPTPTDGIPVFTSIDEARSAAKKLGRAISIYATPASGGVAEFVEDIQPEYPSADEPLPSTDEQQILLDENEVARIDEQYPGFAGFDEWPLSLQNPDLWERRLTSLRTQRESVSADDLKRAQEIAIRAAAVDTGAIEGLYVVDRGFTMTVATQAAAWEVEAQKKGESFEDFFKAHLRAYELVLDAVMERLPITEAWVRRLHEEICASQDVYEVRTPIGIQYHPLAKGTYKTHPNHVRTSDGSIHAYAPVSETPIEMDRLISELRSERFGQAHPVLQAAYSHHALVAIHPFADGNGRVARALASFFLVRAASVPLLIFADQKLTYFKALAEADRGDPEPFIRFTHHRAMGALDLIGEMLLAAKSPSPELELERLAESLTAQGGLSHQELDEVGTQLLSEVSQMTRDRVEKLSLPRGVDIYVSELMGTRRETEFFRGLVTGGSTGVAINLSSKPPAGAYISVGVHVLISKTKEEAETFLLAAEGREDRGLTIALDDAYPHVSENLQVRLGSFINRVIGEMTSQLRELASEALRQSGYR